MGNVTAFTMTRGQRLEKLGALVKKYKKEEDLLKKGANEASIRVQYLDELLECLGWDVRNEEGARDGYKSVRVEDNVLQDNGVKHTDYTLCIGDRKYLVVEAKKPAVDIKNDNAPAIQARKYARSFGLGATIVTNFAQFCVYSATVKISPQKDKAATARLCYYTYDEYVEKFDELYERFSYDAVKKGDFQNYLGDTGDKKGMQTVDEDFLAMIERWRKVLAADISLHNDISDEVYLTAITQRIIDRVVFR